MIDSEHWKLEKARLTELVTERRRVATNADHSLAEAEGLLAHLRATRPDEPPIRQPIWGTWAVAADPAIGRDRAVYHCTVCGTAGSPCEHFRSGMKRPDEPERPMRGVYWCRGCQANSPIDEYGKCKRCHSDQNALADAWEQERENTPHPAEPDGKRCPTTITRGGGVAQCILFDGHRGRCTPGEYVVYGREPAEPDGAGAARCDNCGSMMLDFDGSCGQCGSSKPVKGPVPTGSVGAGADGMPEVLPAGTKSVYGADVGGWKRLGPRYLSYVSPSGRMVVISADIDRSTLPASAPPKGEAKNFVVEYLKNASPEELAELDKLAELDRKYGNKPTPPTSEPAADGVGMGEPTDEELKRLNYSGTPGRTYLEEGRRSLYNAGLADGEKRGAERVRELEEKIAQLELDCAELETAANRG